jgi:hypothetical protein
MMIDELRRSLEADKSDDEEPHGDDVSEKLH